MADSSPDTNRIRCSCCIGQLQVFFFPFHASLDLLKSKGGKEEGRGLKRVCAYVFILAFPIKFCRSSVAHKMGLNIFQCTFNTTSITIYTIN